MSFIEDYMEFLRMFFNDAPKTFLEIKVISVNEALSFYMPTVEEALAKVVKWKNERVDIYFGVCPRTERRTSLETVREAHVVWADLDVSEKLTREDLMRSLSNVPLPPSAVVSTGNGYHAYWVLDEPTSDWGAHEACCRKVQEVLRGDAVSDRTRLMRVPDTLNYKDRRNPKPVVLLTLRPEFRYKLTDIEILPTMSDRKLLHKIWTGDSRGYKSRSERDWAVTTSLMTLGLSDLAISNIFEVFPVGDRAREDHRYFETTLCKARESVGVVSLDEIVREPSRALASVDFLEGADDCLYRQRKKGAGLERIATFVLDPIMLLKCADRGSDDVLMCDVKSAGYKWQNIPFTRKAFTKLDAMQRELQVAAWQWLGTDAEVRLYLPFLMEALRSKGLPHARATTVLGRHGDLWASEGITLSADNCWEPLDAPIVYLRGKGEDRRLDHAVRDVEELKQKLCKLLPKINEPCVIWPVLGWFFACPFKPVLAAMNVRFPVLNLFGTRGSGKTSTIVKVMLPLMGVCNPYGRDCNTTRFVMLTLLGSTNALPVFFTEYRPSLLGQRASQQFMRYLLISYDVGQDARGRPDQSIVYYDLCAPFVVDGEDMIVDAAAKERVIAVDTHPEMIREGSEHHKAFRDLVMLPLTTVAGSYLQYSLNVSTNEAWEAATQLIAKAFPQLLPDRVRCNLTVVALGIACMCDFLGLSLPNLGVCLQRTLDNVVDPTGRTSLVVDDFVTDLVNVVALQQAERHIQYKYYSDAGVLWFHLTTALNWWFTSLRRKGKDALESAAIKQQLQERMGTANGDYIVGRKAINIAGATRWCYGIDLSRACAAGLDIPDALPEEKTFVFQM